MATEREAYGSGLRFTTNWDFEISETGSLGAVEGLKQLEKKLAYATTKRILPEIGQPRTREALEDIRIRIERVANEDPRIDSVERVVVERSSTDSDQVDATLEVVGDDDEKHTLAYTA